MTTAWFSVSHSVGCIGGLTMASITTYPSGEGQRLRTWNFFLAPIRSIITTILVSLFPRIWLVRQRIRIRTESFRDAHKDHMSPRRLGSILHRDDISHVLI